ncbi:unnamed protein product [Somion occarium]|uniref:WW domain-containing protein n=1 Tax=Somion occarium TaxID=3059160 RepID=A0ABP1DPK2_9APHY
MSSASPESLSPSSPHEQGEHAAKMKEKQPQESTKTFEDDGRDNADSQTSTDTSREQSEIPSVSDWQAIWSPAHTAYYFYNATTQETTWTNPLQSAAAPASPTPPVADESPAASTSTTPPLASVSSIYQLQAAAAAQGIDPSLAFLDPSLAAGPSTGAAFEYTAKFNARTGTFAKPDARDPTHLSEYERAKRMSQFYFDVNAWEAEVAERKEQEEAEGKKRKRPSKKDLERFKEQKRLKKIAKTAWLRT